MVRRHYRHTGPLDDGEAAALRALGSLEGLAILDVGVGGGRTTALLQAGAGRYVGIDLSPRMIRDARRRHPGADLRVGDARDLGELADGSFDVVMFSNNGIDAVAHEERAAVLAGFRRALRPGGRALLSTFNLRPSDGPGGDDRPRLRDLVQTPSQTGWKRPVVRARHVLYDPIAFYNYARVRRDRRAGDGWAEAPMRAHEFRFLVRSARFDVAVAELLEAGLRVEAAWDPDGTPIAPSAPDHPGGYSHLLADAV